MYCKNCGNFIADGDLFCSNCGQAAENVVGSGGEKTYIKVSIGLKDSPILRFIKMYFMKPASFFDEMKNYNLLGASVGFFIGMPIVFALLSIVYKSSIISWICSSIRSLPDYLSDLGIISKLEKLDYKLLNSDYGKIKDALESVVENKDIFINNFLQMIMIIALTAIIIEVINRAILNNRISVYNVLFLSSVSYIPLMISVVAASLVTLVSLVTGIFIIASGYVLSFITLYNGMKSFLQIDGDKAFKIISIFFIVLSIMISVILIEGFKDSAASFINEMKNIEKLI